ncbi:hypothetical protein [Geodermatophilus sabuli]|uniref:hypothetical protein n=1 Tax=Geodermatophilus sabuli TaxID=1564158 RepID=UPI00195413E5|nr:hypothetical protein [Geodermatophilus sabuli]
MTDLVRALRYCAELGFLVSAHDESHGFAAWEGLELHVAVVPGHDPLRTASTVHLHVPDADAVSAAWADVAHTTAAEEKPWGVREGAHVDPDGDLLRLGSPLASDG